MRFHSDDRCRPPACEHAAHSALAFCPRARRCVCARASAVCASAWLPRRRAAAPPRSLCHVRWLDAALGAAPPAALQDQTEGFVAWLIPRARAVCKLTLTATRDEEAAAAMGLVGGGQLGPLVLQASFFFWVFWRQRGISGPKGLGAAPATPVAQASLTARGRHRQARSRPPLVLQPSEPGRSHLPAALLGAGRGAAGARCGQPRSGRGSQTHTAKRSQCALHLLSSVLARTKS